MPIVAKIEIPSYLKEYCVGKYNDFVDGPIRFPDSTDLYHVIYDLLAKRPQSYQVDSGNFEIILPNRGIGKNPGTYNYLSKTAQKLICRKLEVMMFAEAHDFLDTNKHQEGIDYLHSVHTFMRKYDINAITEDAFIKNYYRWRDRIRKKNKKRNYRKN